MAKKALLIWCAGSAVICGSAALATTSLWRSPVSAPASAPIVDIAIEITVAELPADLSGFDVVEESARAQASALPPLASISFFSPSADGASNLFRPALAPDIPATASEPAAATAPAGAAVPPQRPDFAEIVVEDFASRDPRLAVRPPPRPSFTLARLDGGAKPVAEVAPEQPAPGFAEPQNTPWSLGGVFRTPEIASRSERVVNAGMASWYGPGFHGRKTASGERFNQHDLTAAHRTLPFGTRVKVIDEKTGRSVVVRINDRGPFAHGRVIDLSRAASQALGMGGVARVKVVTAAN